MNKNVCPFIFFVKIQKKNLFFSLTTDKEFYKMIFRKKNNAFGFNSQVIMYMNEFVEILSRGLVCTNNSIPYKGAVVFIYSSYNIGTYYNNML